MCVFVHFSSPTPKHLIASKCVYLALRSPYNNNAAINIRNINQEATKAIIQKLYTVRVLTTHPLLIYYKEYTVVYIHIPI